MLITLLKSKDNMGKVPFSPFDDFKFLFITLKTKNIKEMYKYMIEEFSLSNPLILPEKGIIDYRRIKNLKKYKNENTKTLVLDLDDIDTIEKYFNTIEYFRNKKYRVILGKSRGFNNKDCFNIKGIIQVDIKSDNSIQLLSQIQSEIGDNCKVDLNASLLVSTQAPIKNKSIILYNEKGKILKDKDIYMKQITKSIKTNNVSLTFDNDLVDECLNIFGNLGYSPMSNVNSNGSINFKHTSEVKSIGSYFWFANNPLVMNHPIKEKTSNIFHLLKETKIGKEWLKNRTKENQDKLLNSSNNKPKREIIVNERYLDFSKKDKQDLLIEFLDNPIGVLKIKSPMGTGKSSGIDFCIKETHKRNEKVIIVTNKISVAEDFSEKYNIMLYKNKKSLNSTDSLIVQYDSLHKYNLSNYDLVVFDEFFSLLLHHRANLTDNANINAVKFKILMDKKRTIIADAFLTGYESNFFEKRDFYNIINEFQDDIKLFDYSNRNTFLNRLIKFAENMPKNEHLTCSFTSMNVMRIVELELKEIGIRVACLSSETSEISKKIIYNSFNSSNHNHFQVLLYTSTLTVGVSNNNNITSHWHFDTGMSTDVISSLQMIKRSRKAKEIHFYLTERQFYYDVDIDSINNNASKHITTFYNNKDKALLVIIDYETGELSLTPLAKYINSIEVFYNILENNHANAFRSFLSHQFNSKPYKIEDIEDFDFSKKSKEVKRKLKQNNLKILEKYSDVSWNKDDIMYLTKSTIDLSDLQKSVLMQNKIKEKFPKLDRKGIKKIASLEIENDYKFISRIKNMKTYLMSKSANDYAKYTLSDSLGNDISSLQNKSHVKFLENCVTITEKLKKSYSKIELKEKHKENKDFVRFLSKLGYKWNLNKFSLDERVIEYVEYIK